MRRRLSILAAASGCALALAAPASAGTEMFVGAAEDGPRSHDPADAAAKMTLARLAGMDAIRVTSTWKPGLTRPTELELEVLRNVVAAARLNGIRVFLSVYHADQRTTPRTRAARAQFAAYAAAIARELPEVADFIIGNEPNLNLFWMPQFDRRGRSVSPAAYLRLLAVTYDALKRVSPHVNVIGGSVSPRGQDRPRAARQTHSPVRFVAELGEAYRASRRLRPVMDAFAFHPYLIPSRLPPTFRHAHPRNTTIGLSDYDKLVAALADAFDGTGQQGSSLPIVYDEFGYQSIIPPEKEALYANLDTPAARDAIPEAQQGEYYAQALGIAQCQPNVTGILIFHVSDEADAHRWQSGLYYADDTPKTSLPIVADAALKARAGTLTRCALPKEVTPVAGVRFPEAAALPAANDDWSVRLDCERACEYTARIVPLEPSPLSALSLLAGARSLDGQGLGGLGLGPGTEVSLPRRPLPPGTYRWVVRAYELARPGTAVVRYGEPFTVEQAPEAPVPSAP